MNLKTAQKNALKKLYHLGLIVRKQQTNANMLQNNQLFFKFIRIWKDKRLRNCPRLEETTEARHLKAVWGPALNPAPGQGNGWANW